MTLRQFFTALEHALRTDPEARPHLTNQGKLRLDRGGIAYYCPITYVAQRLGKGEFDTTNWTAAAAVLALAPRTRCRLYRAADNLSQSQTRQQLEALWHPAHT